MAEQTTTNSIHPQDGNQIVIGENHATITINNHNKTNENIDKICEKLDNFFRNIETRIKDDIKNEKRKSK